MQRLSLFFSLAAVCSAAPVYTVVDLGPRSIPAPIGLSSNGQYAVGTQASWIWSQSGGVQVLLNGLTGGDWQEARGVNSSGVAVGYSNVSSPPQQVLIWNGTTLQSYLPGGATLAQGWGINDAGVVTGYAEVGGTGRMIRYDTVNNVTEVRSETSFGTAINSAGTVAGWALNAGNQEAAILTGALNAGTLQFLGQASGGTFSRALGISSNGLVAGTGNTASLTNAALYWASPGSPVELARLGQPNARANGVNAAGQVVGHLYGGAMGSTGVVWDGFVAYDLTTLIQSNPGWDIREANAINDLGQILAVGRINGVDHIVRLDPANVPEPSTALMTLGAAVVGWVCRKKIRG